MAMNTPSDTTGNSGNSGNAPVAGDATSPSPSALPEAVASELGSQRLFETASKRPLFFPHVDEIIIKGNVRTRTKLIMRELAGLDQARSLEDLKDAALSATERLERLGTFRSVQILFDEGPADDPGSVTANVSVAEHERRYGYRAQTYVTRKGDKGVDLAARLHNVSGWGDTVECSITRAASKNSTFQLQYSNPTWIQHCTLRGRMFQTVDSREAVSSYVIESRGVAASVLSGPHSAELQAAWLHLYDDSCSASHAVRAQLGHVAKLAGTHTFKAVADFLQGEIGVRAVSEAGLLARAAAAPADPYLKAHLHLRTVQPLFGLLGIRSEAARGVVRRIFEGARLELGADCGLLLPLQSGGGRYCAAPGLLSERFLVGGMPSVRGFKQGGIGPAGRRRGRDAPVSTSSSSAPPSPPPAVIGATHDALGCDAFATVQAMAAVPLPFHQALRALNVSAQAFVNAGTGALRKEGQTLKEMGREMTQAPAWRVVVGGGLLIPTQLANIELSYVRVLRKGETDATGGRFEIGVSSGVL